MTAEKFGTLKQLSSTAKTFGGIEQKTVCVLTFANGDGVEVDGSLLLPVIGNATKAFGAQPGSFMEPKPL